MKKAPAESDGALVRLDFSQVTKPVSLDLQRLGGRLAGELLGSKILSGGSDASDVYRVDTW